jgi:hypothetical protein
MHRNGPRRRGHFFDTWPPSFPLWDTPTTYSSTFLVARDFFWKSHSYVNVQYDEGLALLVLLRLGMQWGPRGVVSSCLRGLSVRPSYLVYARLHPTNSNQKLRLRFFILFTYRHEDASCAFHGTTSLDDLCDLTGLHSLVISFLSSPHLRAHLLLAFSQAR